MMLTGANFKLNPFFSPSIQTPPLGLLRFAAYQVGDVLLHFLVFLLPYSFPFTLSPHFLLAH
jgi:hypothetical protein